MPKPSQVPDWNTGGGNRTEPSAGEKASGYAVNDVPSSGKLNWLLNLAGQWASYLNGLSSGTEGWSATQIFNGAAGDLSAAMETQTVPTSRKLIWIGRPTANVRTRIYLTSTRALEFVTNAAWNGTQWVKDVNADVSSRFIFNAGNGLRWERRALTTSPFNDSAWIQGGIWLDKTDVSFPWTQGAVLAVTGTVGVPDEAAIAPVLYSREAGVALASLGSWSLSGGTIFKDLAGGVRIATINTGFSTSTAGAQSTSPFTVPSGYRPANTILLALPYQNGTTRGLGQIEIASNGVTTLYNVPAPSGTLTIFANALTWPIN